MGVMMGAMIAVGSGKYFDLLSMKPHPLLSFFIQWMLGGMVGLSFFKLSMGQVKKLMHAIYWVVSGVFAMSFLSAFLVNQLTDLDFRSALLSSTPGGLPEMATLAQALALAAPLVAALHLFRMLAIMSVLPLLVKWMNKWLGGKG